MATPKSPGAFKPDFARRPLDLVAPGARPPQPDPDAGTGSDGHRKLILGREISLTGEISSCDHLVVEGRIEAKLTDCQVIDVAYGGHFDGAADVHEATIGGAFTGELTVRGKLKLQSQGLIQGVVRYGSLEVETGGRIIGTIEPLDMTASEPEPAPQPDSDAPAGAEGDAPPMPESALPS